MSFASNERRLVALGLSLLVGGFLTVAACSSTPGTTPMDAGVDGGSDAPQKGDAPGDTGTFFDGNTGDAGAAYLTRLTVASTGTAPPVTLFPPFSPAIFDYYVMCQSGDNPLAVNASAAKGATVQITQPTSFPAGSKVTEDVTVPEGKAIVAVVTKGKTSTEYWVRCLPHDFPPMKWTANPGSEKLEKGYYLVGGWWPPPGVTGYAAILDSNGAVVWFSHGPAFGVSDVVALKPNTVSFFPFVIGSILPYETLDLVHMTKTTLQPNNGDLASQHELIELANGDYLVIAPALKKHVDLTGLTLTNSDGTTSPLGPDENIEDCSIIEFEQGGNVVHQWNASDHFDPAKASTYAAPGIVAETGGMADGGVVDVFHCNSIDIDPATGNFLISSRHMNSVFYIDWVGSQKVLWKMGGKNSSKDGATYVKVDDPFVAQHDGRLVKGWSQACGGGTGQVSVYDDQTFTVGAVARAAIYDVVVGGDAGAQDGGAGEGGTPDSGSPEGGCPSGGKPGTATLTWEDKSNQDTGLGGSVRVAADGTRLIGWGSYGTPGHVLSVVDVNHKILLDLYFTNNDTSYRAIEVPLSTFDLELLRKTAGFQGP